MNKILFLTILAGIFCLSENASAQTLTPTPYLSGWNSDKKEIIIEPDSADSSMLIDVASISPEIITSVKELELFAKNIISQDSNIKFIKLASGSTEISYQYAGRFLGIIPAKIRAVVSVDNNYRVKVKFPWYRKFIKETAGMTLNDKESDLSKFQFYNFKNELQRQAWSLQLLSNILKNKNESGRGKDGNIK